MGACRCCRCLRNHTSTAGTLGQARSSRIHRHSRLRCLGSAPFGKHLSGTVGRPGRRRRARTSGTHSPCLPRRPSRRRRCCRYRAAPLRQCCPHPRRNRTEGTVDRADTRRSCTTTWCRCRLGLRRSTRCPERRNHTHTSGSSHQARTPGMHTRTCRCRDTRCPWSEARSHTRKARRSLPADTLCTHTYTPRCRCRLCHRRNRIPSEGTPRRRDSTRG